jgi:hypothetical protein
MMIGVIIFIGKDDIGQTPPVKQRKAREPQMNTDEHR